MKNVFFMKQAELKNKLVAAVRIRGRVNVRGSIAETMTRMHLKRVSNCTLINVNDAYLGMLKKCSNHIAYGVVNEETLTKLLQRGEIEVSPKDLIAGKVDVKEIKDKLPIRLHPPRHGYKSTRLSVKQGGSLGYMGDQINGLLARMV